MNRFSISVTCFCLIFAVLGGELRKDEAIEPAVSFDESVLGVPGVLDAVDGLDDEYSDDCVETFISTQKRKFANFESEHSSLKLQQQDSPSSDSADSQDFDAVYAELLRKPSTCDCSAVPRESEDRRVKKSRLRVASFNAEWLFLFGGGGSVDCPGRGCPWRVRATRVR